MPEHAPKNLKAVGNSIDLLGLLLLSRTGLHDPAGRLMVQERPRPGGCIVLVVEDEPHLRLMAGDLVEDAGLQPVYAADADEAIRILESRDDIRIVFTDVRMPGSMDGLKLAAAVRDRWPPIRLLVVSGNQTADPPLPEDARFFSKPYISENIVSALRELAGQ
jgi:CheY-like chemotaxis protein